MAALWGGGGPVSLPVIVMVSECVFGNEDACHVVVWDSSSREGEEDMYPKHAKDAG